MSLPKPSGLKTPSKIGKPSGLPQPKAEIPAPGSQRKAQNSSEDGTATTTSSGPEPMAAPTPSDDFIIGDRVYIGGTKPGFIAFLGETQFAPGEWAGVVLDEPAGKNDGSVAGVKYFQCEAKRGVFARISKLSRMPGAVSGKSGDSGENTGKSMPHHVPSVSPTPGSNNGGDTPARSNTPRLGLAGRKGSSGSVSSLNNNTGKSAAAVSATNLASLATTVPADSPILKIGARVLVSGSKPGTLRFLGTTDFAKGQWAGVDLDEPNGKNDGAVAGKRYFSCKPMYGLFAPVHKVARMTGNVGIHATPARNTVSTTSLPGATPWSTNRLPMSSNLRREHSTSQDSISSLSSTASSVSRSRVRLGVTSLNNISPGTAQAGKSAQRSLNVSATTSALQKALKEKEEHIEQLLKERDLERSEVARAAAQVDEAESQLAALRTEYERYRDDAEEKLGKGHELLLRKQQDADELSGKLEDEKRKVEDLQFQIEEESISKDDLEVKTEQEEVRVHKLEARLKDERERADRFQAELEKIKISTSNEEKSKTARVSELEEIVDDRTRSMRLMEARLGEIEDKCNTSESKNEKMQETINNLTEQINNKDTASSSKTNEITELKSRISELQRELEASEEKCKQFTNDKTKLEEQIGELMRNSGDSSQQLSLLNEQLRDKDRKLEETQAALSDSSLDRAKLMDKIEEISQQNNVHIETLTNKHNDELQKAHTQVRDIQAEVEKKSSKLGQLTEQNEKDLLELRTRKDCEIEDIRKTLHTRTDEVQQRDQQINDKEQQIQQISMEKQNIESEKQNLNQSLSEVKSEKETLMNELSQIKSSIEHADTEQTALQNDNKNLQEKLNLLQQEKDKALADKEELLKCEFQAAADRNQIDEIRSGLEFEVEELKTHLEDKDTELTEFETRLADLESANKKQTESLTEANAALQTAKVDLEQSAQSISSVQHELTSVISERDSLKVDLEKALQAEQDRFELEEEKAGLETQVQEMSSRLSELDNVKKESLTLRKSVEESRSLIAEKDQEKTLLKEVISRLESENLSLQQFKSSAQDLENENFQLEEKLLNLEQALSDAKERDILSNIDTSGDAILSKLTADKEAAQNQAEFLNSVIVDLHRKNDEIKVQLETFQSGHMVNGSSDGYLDHGSHEHRIAPRLFCDICDQFDLHDTDDCPLQAMSDSPPPSHHHGIRGEQRPYCEVCEVFGHWTEECDEEQTF